MRSGFVITQHRTVHPSIMKFKMHFYFCVILFYCTLFVESKIVHLNGTEIIDDDNLKVINATESVQKWFSVFEPKNISNHSGEKLKDSLQAIEEKNDEEEKKTLAEDQEDDLFSYGTISTRDTTMLSTLRGIFDGLTPMITILSTIFGLFLIFVMIQSPLSPLPVPPLPYPPIGPFPPTNIYPFGVPPPRHQHGVRYAGPANRDSYRIPRNLQLTNETETMEYLIEKVIDSIIPNSFGDLFMSKSNSTWTEQLTTNIKSLFFRISTYVENKGSQFLRDIIEPSKKNL